MNDFETHPIGTADIIKEMESMLDTYRSWHYNSRQRIAELEDDLGVVDAWRNKVIADNERLRAEVASWKQTVDHMNHDRLRLRTALEEISELPAQRRTVEMTAQDIAREALTAVEKASDE